MKIEMQKKEDAGAKMTMLRLMTNFRRVKTEDALRADYCLRCFSADTGETMQGLMVKLVTEGMKTEPYRERFERFSAQWEKAVAAEGSAVCVPGKE